MNTEQKSPGRVSLEGTVSPSMPGFAYPTKAPSNSKQEGIRGNFEKTPLNQAFFSSENFQIIQNKIRKSVYDKSGEIIDPVSTDDLFMVMRAIFLQNSRNLPTDIPTQIAELNERVSVWCVPKIVAEVSMYRTYAKDISSLPVPLSHPVNQSGAGTKSLPFKEFF
jgi:hypothetical protein